MTRTSHNGIPVTIYDQKEARMFEVMKLVKQGKDYKQIAQMLRIEPYLAYKAIEFLRKHGEI